MIATISVEMTWNPYSASITAIELTKVSERALVSSYRGYLIFEGLQVQKWAFFKRDLRARMACISILPSEVDLQWLTIPLLKLKVGTSCSFQFNSTLVVLLKCARCTRFIRNTSLCGPSWLLSILTFLAYRGLQHRCPPNRLSVSCFSSAPRYSSKFAKNAVYRLFQTR